MTDHNLADFIFFIKKSAPKAKIMIKGITICKLLAPWIESLESTAGSGAKASHIKIKITSFLIPFLRSTTRPVRIKTRSPKIKTPEYGVESRGFAQSPSKNKNLPEK